MQKVIFTLAIVLVCFSGTLAQTEQGRWTAGISVGNFSYQAMRDSRSFSANLSPSVGYFIANNLLVGTGLPFGIATAKNGDYYKSTSSSIGLSPFVQYYVGASKLKPYVGLSYSYSQSYTRIKNPGTIYGDKYNSHYSSFSPSVGLAYFINRNVALNAGLSYNFQYATFRNENPAPTTPTPSETKSDYKSLTLGIGFQLFFGK